MIRISRVFGLSGVGICFSKSIRQSVFISMKSSMRKYKCCAYPMKISLYLSMSQFTVLNIEDDENEDEQERNEVTILKPVQESCNHFLSSTMDFLTIVFDAISDSAFQYKTALNELCSYLEKYETSKEFAHTLEELEDAMIGARARVFDCEQKYLELIPVVQSIEKLADAIGELSFLLGEENVTLVLKSTLHFVRENIEIDLTEIQCIKRKLRNFENALVLSHQISDGKNKKSENDGNEANHNNEDNHNNDSDNDNSVGLNGEELNT